MIGNISLAIAFVAGKNLVPSPAAGITALRTLDKLMTSFFINQHTILIIMIGYYLL